VLKSVRPSVTLFSSSGYINDMANGSICVAIGWSGDINIARQRAIDGKTGQNIEALIPSSGGILFFDVMVIPADAPRPGNAEKFINFILRPEVHASLTNKVFYANPNPASKQFVKGRCGEQPVGVPVAGRSGPDGATRCDQQRPAPTDDAHLHRLQDRPLSASA
jgi:putrescine transport system substrate-binding protein